MWLLEVFRLHVWLLQLTFMFLLDNAGLDAKDSSLYLLCQISPLRSKFRVPKTCLRVRSGCLNIVPQICNVLLGNS